MADRTPAAMLTAAADRLGALLAEVYPLPWYESPVRLVPHRGIFDALNREIATAYEESEVPRVSALVVALVNAGPDLVALLRGIADWHEGSGTTEWPPGTERTRALARAILGEAEGGPA